MLIVRNTIKRRPSGDKVIIMRVCPYVCVCVCATTHAGLSLTKTDKKPPLPPPPPPRQNTTINIVDTIPGQPETRLLGEDNINKAHVSRPIRLIKPTHTFFCGCCTS